MQRSEVEFIKQMMAQRIDPANETNEARFKKNEKQIADLKKQIADLEEQIQGLIKVDTAQKAKKEK